MVDSFGCLAQLVERRPYKARVGGSNPSAPTNRLKNVGWIRCALRTVIHQIKSDNIGVVVQLVRIPACHAGGRGFESRPLRQLSIKVDYDAQNASNPPNTSQRQLCFKAFATTHKAG